MGGKGGATASATSRLNSQHKVVEGEIGRTYTSRAQTLLDAECFRPELVMFTGR